MVDYIKAMELIELTARGSRAGEIIGYATTGAMICGGIFVIYLVCQLENIMDNGTLVKRKRIGLFAVLGILCLVAVHFVEKFNPPNYTRNEVRKVARTFGVVNPQNLRTNIEYLRTVAPAYVAASDDKKNNDDWVSEILTKFYADEKPSGEYAKLFANLKK